MHTAYVLSVWLHILAATVWVGGIAFLILVVVPWLRRRDRSFAAAFMRETGTRFRNIAWVCFAIVLATGTFNLWVRGVRPADFADAAWLTSPFGQTVLLKLGLFALVLALSVVHDFQLGPRASAAGQRDPNSPEAAVLRRRASLLGRLNAILALLLVATGVTLVRGCPL